MRSRLLLPECLTGRPFTLEEATLAGVSHQSLRGAGVEHVSRGLYRPASWDFDLQEAARALSRATPSAWISHVTAARLWNALLPPWLSDSNELHLSKPRALPSVRRRGIRSHTVFVAPDEVELADGIRISTRSRTWLDLARVLPLDHLVAMGDELIRVPRLGLEGRAEPYTCIAELRTLVARHPNLQGVVRAREALDLMRVGADSAPETFLRLAMLDAGLPEPELQIRLRPADSRSPSADLGYRRRRFAIQYDGGHHLLEPQLVSDRYRNKAFEAAGWTVLILRKEDLDDGFTTAIKDIRRAIRSAGLDPAAASGFANAF